MKMEPIVSSKTSAIRTQAPGNYPKRNNLHLEHGESLRTRLNSLYVLNYNFSKEQCMLPADDRMIETCRSVLSVLM